MPKSGQQYLSQHLPGIGGHIRSLPEDFRVEEIPAYTPCGSGEHLYLWIEKQGISTQQAINQLCRHLNRRPQDIGYAGQKDTQALTWQYLSIAGIQAQDLQHFSHPRLRILSTAFHRNKLRLGHLRGNRFTIRIRHPHPQAYQRAMATLDYLGHQGAPNGFGPQRYGILGLNALVGRALLRQEFQQALAGIIGWPQRIADPHWRTAAEAFTAGHYSEAATMIPPHLGVEKKLLQRLAQGASPGQALKALPSNRWQFYLNAFQAALFDRLLLQRLPWLPNLWQGDQAVKHNNGACFSVDSPQDEQHRLRNQEISPSGPLFGVVAPRPQGLPALLEQHMLQASGISWQALQKAGKRRLPGTRRPFLVPITGPSVHSLEQGDIEITFQLPAGSFATSVLQELRKTPDSPPWAAAKKRF